MPTGPDAYMPAQYTTPKNELLGCREGAWLGTFLNLSPVYDLSGPDVVALLNKVTVNRDYSTLKVGGSRHSLLCNDKGQLIGDGVLMRREENLYRSYWLAPALAYYAEVMAPEWGMDVTGSWVHDEFFVQIDGPKSLEIMEAVSKKDLHALKFARHTDIEIAGVSCTIHRLGMSGCLAYEMHGPMSELGRVFDEICAVGEPIGLRKLGYSQYCRNHTQAGYPNQWIHFWYPYYTSGQGLADYIAGCQDIGDWMKFKNPYLGSATIDPENAYVTPYDVQWDYLINWDHDFIGKDALLAIKENPPRQAVTLEWNGDDVGAAFKNQIEDPALNCDCDDITTGGDGGERPFVMSLVKKDDQVVGIATGRSIDYYHHKMISLCWLDRSLATEGTEVTVVWGTNPAAQTPIRATVAAFPYYNEEYRNETFDVEKIPHPEF